MGSDHYFSSSPRSDSSTRTIRARLAGRDLDVVTSGGVFSPEHLDQGTRVLLDEVPAPPARGHLLDLGAGWGPIAISLALQAPDATVWAVDVNERALAPRATQLRAVSASRMSTPCCPPMFPTTCASRRSGRTRPSASASRNCTRCSSTGCPGSTTTPRAWLVVAKHLGAESLQRWIADALDLDVARAANSKGFRVLAARRRCGGLTGCRGRPTPRESRRAVRPG